MKEDTARRLLDLYLRQGKEQDSILLDFASEEPEAELEKIKSIVGRTMASLYLDAIHPIISEHPALTPRELRKTS